MKVKVGDVIPKANIKNGLGAKGMWLLGVVENPKAKSDKVNVWASNPEDLNPDSDQEIVEIESFTKSAKEYQGKWYPQLSLNARLKSVKGAPKVESKATNGFTQLEEDDIPF